MRIVAWNIRAGGGRRVAGIADQVVRWQADIIAFSEARGTSPGVLLRESLANAGLTYTATTIASDTPRTNALLIASRWPLHPVLRPSVSDCPGRWLAVRIDAPKPVMLAGMHVPNRVTGQKYPCLDGILAFARQWRGGPALIAGDTNSGRIGIDEERPAFNAREDGWMTAMKESGWRDVYRQFYGDCPVYSWHSPQAGNGFRLDEVFANADMLPRIRAMQYAWGTTSGDERRHALSDHAAMLVDIDQGGEA